MFLYTSTVNALKKYPISQLRAEVFLRSGFFSENWIDLTQSYDKILYT